jgi:hypothetical protein
MQRFTYLYENRMYKNKMILSIFWGKGKDRVSIIKSLIYARVGRGPGGVCYKRSKRNAIKVD